jgi:hypothetical protein
MIATGQSKITRYNNLVDTMLGDPLTSFQALERNDPLALQFNGKPNSGPPRDPLFWAAVQRKGAEIKQLVEQNRELYERYRCETYE